MSNALPKAAGLQHGVIGHDQALQLFLEAFRDGRPRQYKVGKTCHDPGVRHGRIDTTEWNVNGGRVFTKASWQERNPKEAGDGYRYPELPEVAAGFGG